MEIPALFFEHHPNPMLIFDTDTLEILQVNESAVKKYGFSEAEFKHLTIEDIRPPEAIPQLRKTLDNVSDESKIIELGTYRHRTKDGTILYVQLTTQLFPDEERNARIVHIHDISDTIRLKKEVEEAYYDQRQHIDNNPLAMVKYDKNFRIIEWSKRAEEKTGYSKEEVLGTSSFSIGLFDDEESDFVKQRMLDISSGKMNKDRFETIIQLKDGTKMEVLVHASALHNADGDLKSVLAFIENISDRKNYERKLEKRERKFHRLFEDANDGILVLNGLTIVDCNERITEIFGGTKEEIVGKSPLDLSPEMQPDGKLSSEKVKKKIRMVQDGQPQVFEWEHKTLDGDRLDVEVSLNRIELGEDTYIQVILRDLTEHKEIRNELEAEQTRLKRAQRMARIGWWSYEVKNDRVEWSDVLYDIVGIEKENFEATFDAFKNLVHPKDRERLQDVMERAAETEEAIDYTIRIITQNDEIIHAKCRAQSEFSEDGELLQMSGVLQDITEQREAQEELNRSKKLFESLFLDSPVAIAMIDVDGKVQKINRSFERLFGYSEEELVGKDLLRHQLPEERYDEIKQIYEKVFSEEGASKYYEDQRITKSGEVKDLLVGALPVSVDGEAIAAFGIYTDITKLRVFEQDLKDSLKEKEILLAEVHHRVKNNLAIISGLLMLEAMNWDDDTIVSKVLMQSKLRIHSMAKIHEKLYQSKDFANLNLENYVSDLVNTISVSMNGQNNSVEIDIDCDDVFLNINQALPCALIINELVTNSFKYALSDDQSDKLVVKLLSEGDTINIIVRDNGPGLPDKFEQMTEHSLGHRLVNQLVKQIDGEINVESDENAGTRYNIRFKKSKKSGSSSNYFI